MCGIIGYIGNEDAALILLNGIKRLEYRGYDSVGMVTQSNSKFYIKKDVGDVNAVNSKHNFTSLPGKIGICHTRWATHGGVTQINSHPHYSTNKKIVAVHNGIIENYLEIKNILKSTGYKFITETDTEVIPNYIEYKLNLGKTIPKIISDFIKDIKGTFAVLFMIKGEDRIYAMRRDSPLVLGLGNGENYIASDVYAFSNKTNKSIFFDNNEWAIISKYKYEFFDSSNNIINKDIKEFLGYETEAKLDSYEHYMIKEIMEEPETAKRILSSLENEQKDSFNEIIKLIKYSNKVVFVAAGTSYNSSLLGFYYLNKCGIETQAVIASELEYLKFLDKNSLVIAVSQSGETMDVIDALNLAKEKGCKIVSIVNVPNSTIHRMSNESINLNAGQEISVASTKSFVNQSLIFLKIAKYFGLNIEMDNISNNISEIFKQIPIIKEIAKTLVNKKDIYIIGRGINYPVSREIALKIKEVSYIHAESMSGGELKHGTIALIEEGTPVIGLILNEDIPILSNLKEIEARGAKLIKIGTETADLIVPSKDEGQFGILATVFGQLLTYYIALEKKLPIDKPRNLAKCVTVR